ncbi:MAG: hypothetical protein JO078_12200 [Candidatus Eremiobacteraeota bacterium]|nr:hypothetical protein [Candidatus Eremiobacteraeota bacterium]
MTARFAKAWAGALILAGCGSAQLPHAAPDSVALMTAAATSRVYSIDCCGVLNNGDINVYNANLKRLERRIVGGAGDAYTIAFDRSGTLYALNFSQGFYYGVAVTEWDRGAKKWTRRVKGFLWALSMALDTSNNLYVADCNTCPDGDAEASKAHDAIYVYRAHQTKLWRTITAGLHSPRSIAVGPDGYLYVANLPNSSSRRRPSLAVYAPGASTPLRVLRRGIEQPALLTTDAQGNVVLVNDSGHILEYAPALTKVLRTITAQVASPTALAFDASGNLYVANSYQFPAKGTVSVYAAGSSRPRYVITDGISDPVALAVGGSGELYVANDDWGLPRSKGRITLYPPLSQTPTRSVRGGVYGLPTALTLSPVGPTEPK